MLYVNLERVEGYSKSGIVANCGCARKTVSKVIDRAKELDIKWPLNQELTDGELQKLFFPKPAVSSDRRYPDLEYIQGAYEKRCYA